MKNTLSSLITPTITPSGRSFHPDRNSRAIATRIGDEVKVDLVFADTAGCFSLPVYTFRHSISALIKNAADLASEFGVECELVVDIADNTIVSL